jgi:hypothetical protein
VSSTHRANLPAALNSCIPLQEELLALVNASGSSLERDLATFAYLRVYRGAVETVKAREEAAAATQACYIATKIYQQRINKAGQQKVSMQ